MSTFAGYEVLGRVAAGSTGVVWKAHDPLLHRSVAIKELHAGLAGRPAERARLQQEARVLASLDDEHVVAVYDFVEEADRAWIVEEWVEGASLARVLDAHGRLSDEQACGVLRGALLGLAHAHDRGLVHGDVKPANVLVDRAGVAKLVDFGLASPAGERGGSGTPAYISPEAARGEPVDTRSDVYSSAAVLFHLLAGHPAYQGVDAAVIEQHVSAPVPSLPGHVGDVVARALSKDPDQRPQDARAFLRELEEAAERRYGVGWLSRAGIASLVVMTAEQARGRGQQSSSDPSPEAVSVAGMDTEALPAAAGKGLLSGLPRGVLIGGVAAAVAVAGVGVAAATHGGGTRKTAVTQPTSPSQQTPSTAPVGDRPAPGDWVVTTTLTSVGPSVPGPFTSEPPPLGDVSHLYLRCEPFGCRELRYDGQYATDGLTYGPVGIAAVSHPSSYTACTSTTGPSYDPARESTLEQVSPTEYRGTLTIVGFRHAPCTSGGTTFTFGDPSLTFTRVAVLQGAPVSVG